MVGWMSVLSLPTVGCDVRCRGVVCRSFVDVCCLYVVEVQSVVICCLHVVVVEVSSVVVCCVLLLFRYGR